MVSCFEDTTAICGYLQLYWLGRHSSDFIGVMMPGGYHSHDCHGYLCGFAEKCAFDLNQLPSSCIVDKFNIYAFIPCDR